jgi:hypothetical protein
MNNSTDCPRCGSSALPALNTKLKLVRQPFIQYLTGYPGFLLVLCMYGVLYTLNMLAILASGILGKSFLWSFQLPSVWHHVLGLFTMLLLVGMSIYYLPARKVGVIDYNCQNCTNKWSVLDTPVPDIQQYIKHRNCDFNLVEGLQCPNPQCNVTTIHSTPYWLSLHPNIFFHIFSNQVIKWLIVGGGAALTITLLGFSGLFGEWRTLVELLPLLLFVPLIALLVKELLYSNKGFWLIGTQYTCQACKYVWLAFKSDYKGLIRRTNWYEKQLERARRRKNIAGIASNLMDLAAINELKTGDLNKSYEMSEESLRLARQTSNRELVELGLNNTGYFLVYQNRLPEALNTLNEGCQLTLANGNWSTYHILSGSIAMAYFYNSQYELAKQAYETNLLLSRKMGRVETTEVLGSLEGLAQISVINEQPLKALQLLGAAHAGRTSIEYPLTRLQEQQKNQALEAARTQLSAEQYEAAWQEGLNMPLDAAVRYALQRG